jgi:hypothetical protein
VFFLKILLVRFELPRIAPLSSKPSVSANSTKPALNLINLLYIIFSQMSNIIERKFLMKDTLLKGEMRIVLFVSRNKDNKETIPNFKERTVRFLTIRSIEEIEKQFDFFVNYGLPNEFSRRYC